MKYEQLYDGDDWFHPRKKGFREQCCDCGLVHIIDFRTNDDGSIEFKARRDNRATAAIRRSFKFSKDE